MPRPHPRADPRLDRGQPRASSAPRWSGCTREIAVLTDWRGQLVKHQKQVVIGAAVAGFVIGGGIAAFGGLFRRKR